MHSFDWENRPLQGLKVKRTVNFQSSSSQCDTRMIPIKAQASSHKVKGLRHFCNGYGSAYT